MSTAQYSAAEIQEAGISVLDNYIKNPPRDQIGTERPLLAALEAREKSFPGGKQFVVENLRTNYGENYQYVRGASVVTYNRRQPNEHTNWPWGTAHDGLFLDEDRLFQHGITVDDKGSQSSSGGADEIRLFNFMREQSEALSKGFDLSLDRDLHLDGAQHPEAVAGLDHIVSTTPAVGTLAGIDRAVAANTHWRNYASTGIAPANLLAQMEIAFRTTSRHAGPPTFALAGAEFVDAYTAQLRAQGTIQYSPMMNGKVDGALGRHQNRASNTGLWFRNTEIHWDPVFEDLDTLFAPAIPWSKRCYFLNLNRLFYRPGEGSKKVPRKPPRPADQYVCYMAIVNRFALTTDQANAHGVIAIA